MYRNIRNTLAGTLVVGIASLSLAAAAQASNAGNPVVNTTFEGFTVGTPNLQDGWKSTGPFDHKVMDVAGNKMLRISNAITQQSFGDMTFSKPVVKPANEDAATNVLVNEFTIKTDSADEQPGLSMSVSPDDGQGARMSYLRFDDMADGVHVIFGDYRHPAFKYQDIATLTHGTSYTVKFETTFVHGHDNDVVKVSIDGAEKVRGGSWEGYYRFFDEANPLASDRLLFRTAGAAAPHTSGHGFLIDNVMSASSHIDTPYPQGPKGDDGAKGNTGDTGSKGDTGSNGTNGSNGVDGKSGVNGTNGTNGSNGADGNSGVNGTNGTNGVNGKDGVTTVGGKVAGDTLRTIRVSVPKGAKFLGAKATLRNTRLPVKGRTIKVDLRNKPIGNYNVFITVKYAKGGKTFIVKSTRNLSVHTAR